MSKLIAISYSRLNSYEECPRKFHALNVAKTVKEQPSEQTTYGTEVHLAFADFFKTGKPLPIHLQQYTKYLVPIKKFPGQFIVEQKLAINPSYEPTGWFDSDVYCRIISDLTIINGAVGVTFDWKTGRLKAGFNQLRLSSAVLFLMVPELERITHAYFWLKEKKATRETIHRHEMPGVWTDLMPLINRYQQAHAENNFPPRPNYLCKKYCPVKTCQYNGV